MGTQSSKEVDFVEVKNRLPSYGYECKLSTKADSKGKIKFLNSYPKSEFEIVTPENMIDVVWEDR